MKVIVAGCGRVGSRLATDMQGNGHQVTIIDQEPNSFRRLPADFAGLTVQGLAFDRGTLTRAGISEADAFVAVTSGDNSNIVAARIAKERFGVGQVVARIYDPERAQIYERHGITTIATTRWTVDAILGQLGTSTLRIDAVVGPGAGDVVIIGHDLPAEGGPWEVESFTRQGRWVLTAITRVGQTTIPVPRQLVQSGERVHLAVQRPALPEARAHLMSLTTGPAAAAPTPARQEGR